MFSPAFRPSISRKRTHPRRTPTWRRRTTDRSFCLRFLRNGILSSRLLQLLVPASFILIRFKFSGEIFERVELGFVADPLEASWESVFDGGMDWPHSLVGEVRGILDAHGLPEDDSSNPKLAGSVLDPIMRGAKQHGPAACVSGWWAALRGMAANPTQSLPWGRRRSRSCRREQSPRGRCSARLSPPHESRA